MTKALRTQFVIADGARARWVLHSDETHDFVTVRELKSDAGPPAAGPAGVVFENSSGRGSGVRELQDASQRRREHFAVEVAAALDQEAAKDGFQRLALVAPSRMLNAIRERLSGPARAKLAACLAKDLTKVPDHELGPWLRELEFEVRAAS